MGVPTSLSTVIHTTYQIDKDTEAKKPDSYTMKDVADLVPMFSMKETALSSFMKTNVEASSATGLL